MAVIIYSVKFILSCIPSPQNPVESKAKETLEMMPWNQQPGIGLFDFCYGRNRSRQKPSIAITIVVFVTYLPS